MPTAHPKAPDSLAEGDVHVHYRLIGPDDGTDHDAAMRTLSPLERERAGRFVSARDRLSFIAAHSLLRHSLSTYSGVAPDAWRFVADRFGKPALAVEFASVNLAFNLSHTDGLAACLVAGAERAGIDVETTDRRVQPLELAHRYFSPVEVADLEACSQGERQGRFIEIWTLKEAYVKAIGMGLSHSLQTFGFRLAGPSSIQFEAPSPSEASWTFALFAPSERHRMAVAVPCRRAGAVRITAWRGSADPLPALRTSA